MSKFSKIIHFSPAFTSASTNTFNMAHRCVIPLTGTAQALRKKEKGRILLREGEAAELSRHLQNPEFVQFLREHLGVIVTPDNNTRGEILQEFGVRKAA